MPSHVNAIRAPIVARRANPVFLEIRQIARPLLRKNVDDLAVAPVLSSVSSENELAHLLDATAVVHGEGDVLQFASQCGAHAISLEGEQLSVNGVRGARRTQ